MKNVVLFLLFFALGIAFIVIFRLSYRAKKSIPPLVSPIATSQFSLADAPSESLKATITFSGDVDWQSRVATQPSQLTSPVVIQQGESILTKDNATASIHFLNTADIDIAPKTEVDIIQTLPSNIVVAQNQGVTVYTVTGKVPLAIRSFDLLVAVKNGKVTVTADSNQDIVTVHVIQGSATVAYDDVQYMSHTQPLVAGNIYTFDDTTKEGEIL